MVYIRFSLSVNVFHTIKKNTDVVLLENCNSSIKSVIKKSYFNCIDECYFDSRCLMSTYNNATKICNLYNNIFIPTVLSISSNLYEKSIIF